MFGVLCNGDPGELTEDQIDDMIELEDAWSPDLELRDREATAVAGG